MTVQAEKVLRQIRDNELISIDERKKPMTN